MTESLLTKEEADAIRVFRAALEDECFQEAIYFYITVGQNSPHLVESKTRAYKTAIKKILELDDEHLAEATPAICYIYSSARDCGYVVTNAGIFPRNVSIFTEAANKHWASLREKTLNDDVRDML